MTVRPCQVVLCGTVAEYRVGWTPAAQFGEDLDTRRVRRMWFRGCIVHSRNVYLQARRNRQGPVWMQMNVPTLDTAA